MQAFNQALRCVQQRDYPQALALLDRADAAHSRDPDVLGLYGYVNLKLGRFDSAAASLRKALKKRPRNPQLLNSSCHLYLQQGKTDKAIEMAQRCLRADPKNQEAAFNLGSIYFRVADYAKAERRFLDLVGLNPGHAGALTYLGLVCQKQSRFHKAIEYFDAALAIDPDSVEALQNKGVVFNELLRAEAAIDCLARADRLRPDNATICHNLATAYVLAGRPDDALRCFRNAIRLEPLNPEHHHWCNLFLWREQHDEFLCSYRDVLEAYPDAHLLRRELVKKLRLAKRYDVAEAQLDYLIANEDRNPANHKLRGDLLRNQRRFSEALEAHQAAKRIDPDDRDVREALATSYLSLGEAREALEIIEPLIRADAREQGYWALKAIALRLLGSDEYHYLYDYEQLVLRERIEPPPPYSDVSAFNRDLLADLAKFHHSKTQPLDQSLLNGTQSPGDLFCESSEIIGLLKSAFDKTTARFFGRLPRDENHPVLARNTGTFDYTGAWSVMLESSGHHVNHYHSLGWYSGPYYVHLPDEVSDDSNRDGWIKLGEPGFEMVEPLEADFVVRPEEGLMIRFPSYMWHGTFPFESADKRVIVGCDLVPG